MQALCVSQISNFEKNKRLFSFFRTYYKNEEKKISIRIFARYNMKDRCIHKDLRLS